jgi:hypothetical protein
LELNQSRVPEQEQNNHCYTDKTVESANYVGEELKKCKLCILFEVRGVKKLKRVDRFLSACALQNDVDAPKQKNKH